MSTSPADTRSLSRRSPAADFAQRRADEDALIATLKKLVQLLIASRSSTPDDHRPGRRPPGADRAISRRSTGRAARRSPSPQVSLGVVSGEEDSIRPRACRESARCSRTSSSSTKGSKIITVLKTVTLLGQGRVHRRNDSDRQRHRERAGALPDPARQDRVRAGVPDRGLQLKTATLHRDRQRVQDLLCWPHPAATLAGRRPVVMEERRPSKPMVGSNPPGACCVSRRHSAWNPRIPRSCTGDAPGRARASPHSRWLGVGGSRSERGGPSGTAPGRRYDVRAWWRVGAQLVEPLPVVPAWSRVRVLSATPSRPRSSADRAAAFEAASGGSTPPGAIVSLVARVWKCPRFPRSSRGLPNLTSTAEPALAATGPAPRSSRASVSLTSAQARNGCGFLLFFFADP